jgi:hypothetical protein
MRSVLPSLDSLDVGIERADSQVLRGHVVRLLQLPANREGWELRCEVVRPS